jgi:phosphomannomutase
MANPFKAYDIRGLYNKDINEELAYQVGVAYINYTHAKNVVVGMDMRASSPSLTQSLITGLTDAGADVIDIGLASTDMLYFANIHLGLEGGIEVTASHNSKEYNGLKFTRDNAIPIGIDSGLADIEKIVRDKSYKKAVKKGSVSKLNILDDFVKFMHSFVNPAELKPLSVVIDAGNGMGGYIMPKLLSGSKLKITPLFFELDGNFPNHDANPLEEKNRLDLIKKVKDVNAQLGVGLDGDTDRAFFVDGRGEFCSGDFILGLLAKDFLRKKAGSLITYDVRCSRYIKDLAQKMGGRSMMGKVGHAYAKLFMREHDAIFGGEVSGHYYYKYKNAYFDSGNLTVLMLLKVLSDSGVSLEDALKETAGYFISGEINSTVDNPDARMEKIKGKYKGKAEILDIDGVSIITDKWWANVRKSNTEPLLRLNCEAYSKKEMETVRDEFLALIRS